MEEPFLKKSYIQILESVESWQEAIKVAAKPLLNDDCITLEYIEAMIQTVNELGDYIVISPLIALPHARSDGRVKRTALSLLKLDKPVYFSDEESSKATVIMPIACVGNAEHMSMLSSIAEIFCEQENIDTLLTTVNEEAIFELFTSLTLERDIK